MPAGNRDRPVVSVLQHDHPWHSWEPQVTESKPAWGPTEGPPLHLIRVPTFTLEMVVVPVTVTRAETAFLPPPQPPRRSRRRRATPAQESTSFPPHSACSAPCAADAKADREADAPQEDEHTAHAVTVMDGDEHHDPEREQSKAGHKPEGYEALPAVVDGRTVIRLRFSPPLQGASGVIPGLWPRRRFADRPESSA